MRATALTLVLLTLTGTLAVAQEPTITGRVIGPDGEGVAGARVAIVSSYAPPLSVEWTETTSGDDGSFEFESKPAMPDGTTMLVASAEGLGVWGAMARPGDPVELHLTDDVAGISGIVTEADGHAVEGAIVHVIALQGKGRGELGAWLISWDGAPCAVTDAQGRFGIGGLPNGARAALEVGAEGFASVLVIDEDEWPLVGQAEDVALTVQPGSSISGHVRHDGEPVGGVKISAMAKEPPISWGDAVTDADGCYEIGGLASGPFIVMAEAPDGLIGPPHEDVAVQAGGRAEGIDFELSTGAVIRGRITWQDTGEPVAGTSVVTTGRMSMGNHAMTDEDGRYELRVPAGTSTLQWSGPQTQEARGAEPDNVEVTMAADEVREGVDFRLLRKRSIELTVLDPDGQPVPGATIWWDASERYGSRGTLEPIVADEGGRVTLMFGREVRQYGTPVVLAVAQDLDRGLAGMALVNGETDDIATIRLTDGAWVESDVRKQDGEPLPDIAFRASYRGEESPGDLPLHASTDADGHLRFGPLPANVQMEIGPSWRHRSVTLQPRPQEMPTVELAPGETVEIGPFVLAPDGLTVRGTVIDADGAPVEGAIVASGNGASWSTVQSETDAEGRFELPGLGTDEETAVVMAVAPDGSAAWAEPVDPTVAFEPTIELATPGTLFVTIRGADGRAVQGMELRIQARNVRSPRPLELPGELIMNQENLRTDAEGRVRIERLMPGIEYSIAWRPNPEEDMWRSADSVMIYGGEEPVEVDVTLGE